MPTPNEVTKFGGGGGYIGITMTSVCAKFVSGSYHFYRYFLKNFVSQKDCLWSEGLVWSWPKVLRARSRSLAKKCKFYVRSKSLFGEIFEVLTMLLHTKFDYYLRMCHNIDPSHSCNIKVTGRKKATFVSGPYFFIEKHWKILF